MLPSSATQTTRSPRIDDSPCHDLRGRADHCSRSQLTVFGADSPHWRSWRICFHRMRGKRREEASIR